ncbi:MAG: LamG-like jellyroll fold domain-containing protein [Promethearchaeota archaeon]
MKHITKHNIKYIILFTTILLLPTIFSVNSFVLNNRIDIEGENYSEQEFNSENELPESSDVFQIDSEYDLSQWWDTRFRYRIAFNVEETNNIDRYQPVDVPLSFEDYEHFEDSARLVSFNVTGNDEWSSPIPIQLWDETYYSSGYIEDCMMTFIADVSAGENQTYFLYFNENLDNIGVPSYSTDFSSILASGALTVTVGNLGDLYKTVLEEGKGVPSYIKDGNNYHIDESISPEKQLSHPSLSFLAHMDEGMGNNVNDSTGNVAAGLLMNSPSWVDGVVRKGLDFDSSASQFVNFGGALDGPGEPFHDLSTEFTMTVWLNPSDYSHTAASNHGTRNCFIAKASDPYNDNFEVGVNTDGTIHVYIDCDGSGADTQTDFGNAGDVIQGQWNFIAVRFDVSTGLVDVRINDDWYSSSAWSGATDMDAVVNSLFTIGSTDHSNIYFDGIIDEVALYNVSLSNQEVENYKYGSETSTIETITELINGDIFSRYQVDWTESFDMQVSDICTFYYDYNLWNINRTVSFDNEFNGEETNSQMVSLNTYYDFSGVTQSEDFYYIYDGNLVKGLNNDGYTVENYTIIHDPVHQDTKNTLGIFVPNFYASGDAFSEVSYLEGTFSYDSGTDMVMYNPGSINDFKNNANPNNKLHIEFWEFIDHVNDTAYLPKLDDAGMAQLFEDMYSSLKNPVNVHIFEKDSKFYNLQVNVTDIDQNLVPDAKITLWNNTDMTEIGTAYTDENGLATFTRLNNGTFLVNATYEMYGQAPLVITTPQIIDLNEGSVDSTGRREISFENVTLTSLDLTLDRFNSTGDYQGRLDGAKVSFWIDDGTDSQFIGSENSDVNGNVVFRWSNFTNQADGNVTFGIEWFGFAGVVDAPGDLDISNILNTTYYFYQAHSAVVNATFGSSFDTELIFTQIPTETEMLGDLVHFQVNFTQIANDTIETPLTVADVDYDIKIGAQIINTQTLSFLEIGLGIYSLTIDTNDPVEPSGVDWLSSVSYTLEVQASKPGYISQVDSISFTLLDKTSSLVADDMSINAYWNELLVLDVVYTDISFGGNNTIDSASVQYAAIGVPSVVGFLTPYGSGGRYLLEIPTTDFTKSGTYTIQITANDQNYQEKSIFITATIFAIKSGINGSVGVYEDIDVPFRDSEIFYFNYTVDSTGEGLTESDIKTYEWTKEIGDVIVDSGAGTLFEIGGGMYSLNFDTETLEIATYTLIFDLEKENYAGRSGIIILHIVERVINVTADNIIQAVSGQVLTFDIDIRDILNSSALLDCVVSLTLQGKTYDILNGDIVNNGDGTYSITIDDLPDAFFLPTPIAGTITITLTNYESKEIGLTINVGRDLPWISNVLFHNHCCRDSCCCWIISRL